MDAVHRQSGGAVEDQPERIDHCRGGHGIGGVSSIGVTGVDLSSLLDIQQSVEIHHGAAPKIAGLDVADEDTGIRSGLGEQQQLGITGVGHIDDHPDGLGRSGIEVLIHIGDPQEDRLVLVVNRGVDQWYRHAQIDGRGTAGRVDGRDGDRTGGGSIITVIGEGNGYRGGTGHRWSVLQKFDLGGGGIALHGGGHRVGIAARVGSPGSICCLGRIVDRGAGRRRPDCCRQTEKKQHKGANQAPCPECTPYKGERRLLVVSSMGSRTQIAVCSDRDIGAPALIREVG